MIDTDKYEGHTEDIGKWQMMGRSLPVWANDKDGQLVRDAVYLLAEVKRLRKALHIEEQIVQAFYEYREDCCFDHCEAWMLEKGHRVMVKYGNEEQSEWKVEVE